MVHWKVLKSMIASITTLNRRNSFSLKEFYLSNITTALLEIL